MTCHDEYDIVLEAPQAPELPPPARYVVGLDGSPASAAALRWAVHQAGPRGRVEAVYAFHGPTLLPAARAAYLPTEPSASLGQQIAAEEQVAAYVREALAEQPVGGVVVHTLAVGGEPTHVLVDQSLGADVLVVGASHRTAFATRVLGSTASTCAAIAHCPVMVVPESWVPREVGTLVATGS